MQNNNVFDGPFRHRAQQRTCDECLTRKLCLAGELDPVQLRQYQDLPGRQRLLHRGEQIIHQGDAFTSFYIVQSGSVKSYMVTEDGQCQITGFHFSGDILGIEGLKNNRHDSTLEALETTSVCDIQFNAFEQLGDKLTSLKHTLIKSIVIDLNQEKQHVLVLGKMQAEQRLAWFILKISSQGVLRGKGNRHFELSMSRHDIANFLGLALETVSRWLTRFDAKGLIRVKCRSITIIDKGKLTDIAASAWVSDVLGNTA